MIDLLAILPSILSLGIIPNVGYDLRSLRVIRLLRVLRLFKLLRGFNDSFILLRKAFYHVRREIVIFAFIAVILLYISSVGIYYFEHDPNNPGEFGSIFDCMWWATTTMTTVGYGDIVPLTTGGKIFTALISFIGIGVIAIPTSLLASSLTNLMRIDNDDLDNYIKQDNKDIR